MTNTTKTLEELQKDSRDDIVAHAYKTGFIAALDACREKMRCMDHEDQKCGGCKSCANYQEIDSLRTVGGKEV